MSTNTKISDVSCTVCGAYTLRHAIHFGPQPPSNRFILDNSTMNSCTEDKHPLSLGFCEECCTIQLSTRMPMDMIVPKYDWLNYNEPEGHLDDTVEKLFELPGIGTESLILGVTYKDKSTIDRFTCKGVKPGKVITQEDLEITANKPYGLETVQKQLRDPIIIKKLKAKYGKVDLLLARHIVEHSEDAASLIRSLRELIKPEGYLIMEFPDSDKIFISNNHAFIWEEHISYFTKHSIKTICNFVDAELSWSGQYAYPYEDSLVTAFKFLPNSKSKIIEKSSNEISKVGERLHNFGQSLEEAKEFWRTKLTQYLNKGYRIAVFGAGHLAAKFINFLQISDLFNCVIDDNPNKVGMKMAGSSLPILSSTALDERDIKICISTLSPESEVKVKEKLASYFQRGGVLISAFSTSENSK